MFICPYGAEDESLVSRSLYFDLLSDRNTYGADAHSDFTQLNVENRHSRRRRTEDISRDPATSQCHLGNCEAV